MKTRFVKFLALALAMLMMASAFAGCGKTETPNTPDNEQSDENDGGIISTEDDGKIVITDTFYPRYNNQNEYASMRASLEKWVREQLQNGSIFSAELQEVVALGGNNASDLEIAYDALKSRWTASDISEKEENGDKVLTKTYTDSASGLVFTTTVILYGDVPTADIKTVVVNTSDKRSPVIKDFYAIDSKYPLAKGNAPIKLTTLLGSFANYTDFDLVERNLSKNFVEQKKDSPGNIKITNDNTVFCPTGDSDGIGFSSSGYGFPYFDLIGDDKGIMMAIGWSGQWEGKFKKDGEGNAVIVAGQQNLSTFLEAGESIEAPRIVLTYFEGGDREYGHNIWREMMFSHYTPDNDTDPTNENDFRTTTSLNFWGGIYGETVKTAVNNFLEAGGKFDILWFDAGWSSDILYSSTAAFNANKASDRASWKTFIAGKPTTTFNNSTATGAKYPAWVEFMGDYIENDLLFPNGIEDIGNFIDDTNEEKGTNLRFMLWWMIFDRRLSHSEYTYPGGGVVEPAGKTKTNILTQEEIEKYKEKYPNLDNLVDSDFLVSTVSETNVSYGSRLDMSKDTVLNKLIDYFKYMYDVKGVDCIRLDNCNAPLRYWMNTDMQYQIENTDISINVKDYNDPAFYRKGYTENKWTTNEYKLWDALRAYNPEFFLDNTASGGRRLDIEMVSRSVSLWRTDFNGRGDAPVFYEAHQKMTQNLASWVPLSSAGYIVTSDVYASRCIYSAATSIQGVSVYDNSSAGFKKIVELSQEIETLRPYWYGNYYQILPVENDARSWQAYMLYREDWQEGMIVTARHISEPIMRQTIKLKGLMEDREYTLHNIDDEGTEKDIVKTGKELMEKGITLTQDAATVNIYVISLNRIDTDVIK